ncbi:MAG TPA: NADH-quinone oxidoreductase subunit N [Gemmatimonadaceae bacterium]|nr:NADH-quinone oxidoreductase subunit N [Gemmatimonadaceae bacterium]
MNQAIDYHAILPELILSGTIVSVLFVDAMVKKRSWVTMPLGLVGVVAALVATLTLIGDERSTFDGSFVVDDFAVMFKLFFLSVAIVVLAISLRYFRDGRVYQGEYYFLLLTSFLGCLTMPSSRDLLVLFISLELVSAPGFLIAAFRKTDLRSNEAGLKFFLIGVLSTAVMLYGMSLMYGVTGATNLSQIGVALAGDLEPGKETLALAAILFITVGFGFKVSAVPFQFWAPDTYEGAPVPVAAFLATASKAAGFAGLLQLMFVAFPAQFEFWTPIFAVLSILTMTIGNFVALQQRQAVRLLAYSSIAQAGYMLLPFALVTADQAANQDVFAASTTYILIYAVMTLGAFAVVTALSRESRALPISDFDGFAKRAPMLTVAMTVFMISLAGIPPMAGFWAKFMVFRVAIERGGIGVALAVIMLVNSVVSIAYYLAIPRAMIFQPAQRERPFASPALVTGVAFVAMVTVVAVGIYPELLAHFPPLSTLVGR